MKKKRLSHVLAIVALAVFVALGLGSDAATMQAMGMGGGGGGGCGMGHSCYARTNAAGDGSFIVCHNSNCAVHRVPNPVPANTNVRCNC